MSVVSDEIEGRDFDIGGVEVVEDVDDGVVGFSKVRLFHRIKVNIINRGKDLLFRVFCSGTYSANLHLLAL